MPPSPHTHLSWLLQQLRRLILQSPVLRGSVRALLFLWSLLRRHCSSWLHIPPPPPPQSLSSSSVSTIPTTKSIEYDLPFTNNTSLHRDVICASTVPAPAPPVLTIGASSSGSPARLSSTASRDLAIPCDEQFELGNLTPSGCQSPIFDQKPFTAEPEPISLEGDIADVPSSNYLNNPAGGPDSKLPLSLETPPRPGKWILTPIMPDAVQCNRYDNDHVIPREEKDYMIKKHTKYFPLEHAPKDWLAFTHPEGALFFCHKVKRVITTAYLCDAQQLSNVNACMEQIHGLLASADFDKASLDEVVIELLSETECGYYFVDHENRSLLWLHDFDILNYSNCITEVRGATSPAHIKFEVEAQYWMHWELFPNLRRLTQDIVEELREILAHAAIDSMTSQTSTSPYNAEDLKSMAEHVDRLKVTEGGEEDAVIVKSRGHSECVAGRLMNTFTHQKFLNFHGQPCARLCLGQSIHTRENLGRSWLIRLLSPVLFCAPDVHLRALEKIWVDETVSHVPWNALIQQLNSDWEQFTLYATVIMNANVGFLAINSIAGPGNVRSAAEIASYLSMLASIGSTIIGLLLIRQNKTKDRRHAEAALLYLINILHPTLGLETVAILYSLPYALIMWGTVAFLAAFLFACFSESTMLTQLTVGIPAFFISLLIVWCIYTSWESEERDWWKQWYEGIMNGCKAAADLSKSGEIPRRLSLLVRPQSWGSDGTVVNV